MGFRAFVDRLGRFVDRTRRKGLRGAIHAALVNLHRRAGGATRTEADELRRRIRGLEGELRRLHARANRQGSSLRALGLAELDASDRPQVPAEEEGPLVSVVLPVRDQGATIRAAIESVRSQHYPRWELLVVDDGSSDRTPEVLAGYENDPRVTLFRQEPRGVSAARNRALEAARGSIVAYLDADNVWSPHFLRCVVSALVAHPDRSCVYASQLVDYADGTADVRFPAFDLDHLRQHNIIDLNVFAHRRTLYEKLGGFDETLSRLVDWDLIARYCEAAPPLAVPSIGGIYHEGAGGRISMREPLWHNTYKVQRKLERPVREPLRVLYLLWHYPQLTESYMRWEIDYMRRRGVDVAVWTELPDAPAPFATDVPIHRGRVEDAIAAFKPHVAHVHWLNIVPRVRDAVARAGLPLTARGHSFDFSPKRVRQLQADPVVHRLYLYPHFVLELPSKEKTLALPTAFTGDLYGPAASKDRRMVLRCGAALPGKDFETFFAAAERCPEHRFVLVVGRAAGHEDYPEELAALNRARGERVEIHVDLQADEVAPLVAQAGIFLHTSSPTSRFGMPTGICEALATGAHVIARRSAGANALLGGGVGALYDSPEEAVARIQKTLDWSDVRWQAVQHAATERAFQRHVDTRVLPQVLEDWLAVARDRVLHGDWTEPLDARFQPLLDYLFREKMDTFRHHDGALTAHQIGIGRGLAAWGADLDVCLAGMAHSLYGTEKGGTGYDRSRREELRGILGERAERLVHANCAMERSSFDAAVAADRGPHRLRNRWTGGEITLDEADFDDLCRIHLCDWLEQVPRCGKWSERRSTYRRLATRLGGEALATFERAYALEGESVPRAKEVSTRQVPGAPSSGAA